jgi:hypothetical protein
VSGDPADERAAVLETVRSFLDGTGDEGLLGGSLAEWSALRGETPWADRYRFERRCEHAEIVELTDTTAVVDARGTFSGILKRGSWRFDHELHGPVVLEKLDGRWRILDYSFDGRRQAEAIVLGPLAEQHQTGVTARVLAINRSGGTTEFVLELLDTGAGEVRLSHAYALVESQTLWKRLGFRSSGTAADGGAERVLLSGHMALDLDETILAVALDVRTWSGRRPFVMKVPVSTPDEVVAQRPPTILPPLRGTRARQLIPWAAITALLAWWGGWFAIVVPVYLGAYWYWHVRIVGKLPHRLDPVRFALDTAVAAGAFFALWESPAIYFAVPSLVSAAVFLALWPARRRRPEAPALLALTAGCAWLFLLGTDDRPLSPCHLAGGSTASVADSFAHSVFAGDLDRAAQYEASGFAPYERSLARSISHIGMDPSSLRRRSLPTSSAYCRYLRRYENVQACYRYSPAVKRSRTASVVVGIGCDAPDWRVYYWS